jgi:hypothetical protein
VVDFAPKPLTRIVPAHRKTVEFKWCKPDWMTFGVYRVARERHGMSIQTTCFWCRATFKDEDMLALVQPMRGKNTLLCQSCAAETSSESSRSEKHGS